MFLSREISFKSIFPMLIFPESIFQKPAISFAKVDFPPPEYPTIAVSSPSFAVKDKS